MAKHGGHSRGGGTDWMNAFMNPSRKNVMNWMRGQTHQFDPAIGVLRDQVANLRPENNAVVGAYNTMLGEIPSADVVEGAFDKKKADIAKLISGTDFGVGGRGVSSIVSALGGTPDVASAAGAVSGQGGQGGDVYSKAIMAGSWADLTQKEADKISSNADLRRQMMLGLGQATEDVKKERRGARLNIADLLGKKNSSKMNPLDIANAFMTFAKNKKALTSYLGTNSSGGSGDTTQTTQQQTQDPWSWLQQNVMPGKTRRDIKNLWTTSSNSQR